MLMDREFHLLYEIGKVSDNGGVCELVFFFLIFPQVEVRSLWQKKNLTVQPVLQAVQAFYCLQINIYVLLTLI